MPLAALIVSSLALASTRQLELAIALGALAAILSMPFIVAARELAFLKGSRRVEPEEVKPLLEWVHQVVKEAGVQMDVAILYALRGSTELQLAYAATAPLQLRSREQQLLSIFVHKAAWRGKPVVVPQPGMLLMVMPNLILERLLAKVTRRGRSVVVRIESLDDARMVYQVVKELVRGAYALNEVALAYRAYKLFARLILSGLVEVKGALLEELERCMPFEPPWVRRRVLAQIVNESPVNP